MSDTGSRKLGIRITAPAKLNLLLELVGKRADGYHDLESLMVTLDLCDTLEVFPSTDNQTKITCRFYHHHAGNTRLRQTLESEQNLIARAAGALNNYVGENRTASILLHKRIPSEAGLGGGSSDAAAALMALNTLWELRLSKVELQQLGAELGSDVPFFLADSPWAICRGRGEVIEEISPRANLPVVLVKPDSGLSTREVYQHAKIPEQKRLAATLADGLLTGDISKWQSHVYNVLEEPGRQLNADLVVLCEVLNKETGVVSQMTGSGSACYVLCSHHLQAVKLSHQLGGLGYQQTWITRTRSKNLTCEMIAT